MVSTKIQKGFYYDVLTESDGLYISVWGYSERVESLVIPDTLEGFPVKTISPSKGLTKGFFVEMLQLPSTITAIEPLAFCDNSDLQTIHIPVSVQTIGESAFSHCTSLVSVTLPDGITCIEEGLFFNCASLTSLTLPDSVTEIKDYAFTHCTSLTSIRLPLALENCGKDIFLGCSCLEMLEVPDGIARMPARFPGCTSLRIVSLPSSIIDIEDKDAFRDCPNVTLYVHSGSYAHQYAVRNSIPYQTF